MPSIINASCSGADADATLKRAETLPKSRFVGLLQFKIEDGELLVNNPEKHHKGDVNDSLNNMKHVLDRIQTRRRLLAKLKAKKTTS